MPWKSLSIPFLSRSVSSVMSHRGRQDFASTLETGDNGCVRTFPDIITLSVCYAFAKLTYRVSFFFDGFPHRPTDKQNSTVKQSASIWCRHSGSNTVRSFVLRLFEKSLNHIRTWRPACSSPWTVVDCTFRRTDSVTVIEELTRIWRFHFVWRPRQSTDRVWIQVDVTRRPNGQHD
jgi:hypothetical protein